MTTVSTRSLAIFVASATMGLTLPFAASQALGASQSINSTLYTSDGTAVPLHKAYSFRDRFDYNRAVDLYNQLLQQGKTNLLPPNINDRASIDLYLKNVPVQRLQAVPVKNPLSTKDYVAPPAEELNPRDLSAQERAALARSEKIGKCFSYMGFSEAFYTLCKKYIAGKTPLNTTGFGNDIPNARVKGKGYLSSSSAYSSVSPLKFLPSGRPYYGIDGGRGSSSSTSSK